MDVQLAGAGQVGDNLGATLGAARQDALYAQSLFLFLGLPGAVLAGLLTATIAATGCGPPPRRAGRAAHPWRLRLEPHAARRGRGRCSSPRPAACWASGVAVARRAPGVRHLGLRRERGLRLGMDSGSRCSPALCVALLTVLLPARRDARQPTVAAGRAPVGRPSRPRWMRWWLDLVLLAGAGAVLWLTRSATYALVLAPEGVAQLSVSYWVFAGPALLWIGAALLTWRLTDALLGRGRAAVRVVVRPVAGPLAGTVAATLSRQRPLVARAVVLLALALSFAVSTATFNATYRQQAEVDAQLTNGADVTVTQSPGSSTGPAFASSLAAVPGVRAVEPVQHRYAYVGSDLQDLYGVRPTTIAKAVHLQDTWFRGGTARHLMDVLAAQPDNILVSAETVTDFQLSPGDLIRLRLVDSRTGALVTVPFHYAGVATEFPTAPRDSFLVANAAYIASATGSDAVGAFLVDTGGAHQGAVATRIRDVGRHRRPVSPTSARPGTSSARA